MKTKYLFMKQTQKKKFCESDASVKAVIAKQLYRGGEKSLSSKELGA